MTALPRFMHRFFNDRRGVTLTVFALLIPVIMAGTGIAVDSARGFLVKKRLAQALDAAALATAGSSGDEAALEARMNAYFYSNFEDDRFADVTDLTMTNIDSQITIEATARMETIFMKIFNRDYIDVAAQTVVQKELRGIEVVLVMDNTGSMSENNNIEALRTAATNFVDIMFERAPDPGVIKIGLVPYSTSVNVGPYGLGLNPDGSVYGDGSAFVNNPHDLSYTTSSSGSNWLGCVIEGEPEDITDHEGPWNMYRYCRDEDDNPYCDTWWGWPIFGPNYICPRSHVTPLSSDQTLLLDRIDSMRASGNTLGNYGMVWGWRVISPEFPFEEGAEWNDDEWRKAVIMMTDGENLMHPSYSAYARTWDHDIGNDDLNDKFADICEAMKDDEILIYTITFTSSIDENTKDFYRDCATDSTKYYDTPSQEDLIETFEAISRELSNMYIKE